MPTPQKSDVRQLIKQNASKVFQLSCGCGRILIVARGRATCTLCQLAYAVRVESWSTRAEDPAPVAEEPTITSREGLA